MHQVVLLLGKIRAWVDSFLEKWPSKESQWSSPLANQKQGPWVLLLFSTRGGTSGFLSWLSVTCSWIVSSLSLGIIPAYLMSTSSTEEQSFWDLYYFLKLHAPYSLFSSFQWLSCAWLFAVWWTAAHQASLSITNSQSLLKLTSIELVMPSNHLILCHPLFLLPSIFPSIRVLSKESVLRIRWPKDWSFSFSISPSNEYSGLISFRIDWFDLLAF